jgi:hypothetical protein
VAGCKARRYRDRHGGQRYKLDCWCATTVLSNPFIAVTRSLPVYERHPTLNAFLNGNDGNENVSLVTLNAPLIVSPKDGLASSA